MASETVVENWLHQGERKIHIAAMGIEDVDKWIGGKKEEFAKREGVDLKDIRKITWYEKDLDMWHLWMVCRVDESGE